MVETQSEHYQNFITKVQQLLDREQSLFVTPRFLFEIGIFGSHSAATHAIQDGAIPSVKVSPYRVLIAKEDVISFLKDNYREKQVTKEAV